MNNMNQFYGSGGTDGQNNYQPVIDRLQEIVRNSQSGNGAIDPRAIQAMQAADGQSVRLEQGELAQAIQLLNENPELASEVLKLITRDNGLGQNNQDQQKLPQVTRQVAQQTPQQIAQENRMPGFESPDPRMAGSTPRDRLEAMLQDVGMNGSEESGVDGMMIARRGAPARGQTRPAVNYDDPKTYLFRTCSGDGDCNS